MNGDLYGRVAALVMLAFLFSLTQRNSGQKVSAQVSPQPSGVEGTLRQAYGPKIAEWKRKSLAGYARTMDRKWENWLKEMAK
jgi:hypothetical protein